MRIHGCTLLPLIYCWWQTSWRRGTQVHTTHSVLTPTPLQTHPNTTTNTHTGYAVYRATCWIALVSVLLLLQCMYLRMYHFIGISLGMVLHPASWVSWLHGFSSSPWCAVPHSTECYRAPGDIAQKCKVLPEPCNAEWFCMQVWLPLLNYIHLAWNFNMTKYKIGIH